MAVMMAKLVPLETRIILVTDFDPEPHGRTHWPDAFGAVQDEPGPAIGS